MANEVSTNPADYGLVAYALAGAILDELDPAARKRIVDRVIHALEAEGPVDKEAVLGVARKLFRL